MIAWRSAALLCMPLLSFVGTAQAQISGVAGAAKNQAETWTPPALAAHMRMRFAGRRDLTRITTHPAFEEYLLSKATEISEN